MSYYSQLFTCADCQKESAGPKFFNGQHGPFCGRCLPGEIRDTFEDNDSVTINGHVIEPCKIGPFTLCLDDGQAYFTDLKKLVQHMYDEASDIAAKKEEHYEYYYEFLDID